MDTFVLQAKAISDPTRLRILKLLEDGELCVCDIMEVLGLGQSTASKHLGVLRISGLVEGRKNGTWTYYRLASKVHEDNGDFLKFIKAHLSDNEVVEKDRKRLRTKIQAEC